VPSVPPELPVPTVSASHRVSNQERSMDPASAQCQDEREYELRFAGLFHMGRGFAFPCDAQGKVDLGLLSERARANYLRVRAAVGREFLAPVKCARLLSR
ncbi:MAG TPA: hypothetical protein VN680_02620, partial [Burkholderiaceae bacterium]|nr:hypothetical protein [Burkholderiaceae bacterium]